MYYIMHQAYSLIIKTSYNSVVYYNSKHSFSGCVCESVIQSGRFFWSVAMWSLSHSVW